jgi:predicted outer membrane lipoprotein
VIDDSAFRTLLASARAVQEASASGILNALWSEDGCKSGRAESLFGGSQGVERSEVRAETGTQWTRGDFVSGGDMQTFLRPSGSKAAFGQLRGSG